MSITSITFAGAILIVSCIYLSVCLLSCLALFLFHLFFFRWGLPFSDQVLNYEDHVQNTPN
ncbi:hypothetical protein BDW42DRAFT_176804 [Aspergillus taichungensis]|uniref:Uncharacterized protein n=1 Tax=Aspergillus taichungensis TaxID=482145 RepID=A0A2J5HK77_9EURO|nr:hypothetical protein BDW42DRAFT_176804 [Aspergillus taichungensis]